MKCVCGYEYRASFALSENRTIVTTGDQEFRSIDVVAMLEPECDCNRPERAAIYACPKCGTLQANL